ATPGRESWASLDAAVVYPKQTEGGETFTVLLGGTSDGHLLELRVYEKNKFQLRPRGRPLGQPGIQGLVVGSRPQIPAEKGESGGKGGGTGGGKAGYTVYGVGGHWDGMPRSFVFNHGGSTSSVIPHGIPRVGGEASMVGVG